MVAPAPAPEENPNTRWARLLRQAATPEGTDYDLIARNREALDNVIAWMAVHGPESDQIRSSQEERKIAMMANFYNAAVIHAVLERRPIDSVQDVQIGVYRYPPNTGFFLGQTFRVDGEWVSLYYLEHQYLLGMYEEPGIHMMLNCASQGCPPLRYWTGNNLKRQTDAHLTDFLMSERGMRKDEQGWALTEFFRWYGDQYVDWSQATDLCAYLADAVEGERKDWLTEQIGDCQPRTFPYDWSLNDIRVTTD